MRRKSEEEERAGVYMQEPRILVAHVEVVRCSYMHSFRSRTEPHVMSAYGKFEVNDPTAIFSALTYALRYLSSL